MNERSACCKVLSVKDQDIRAKTTISNLRDDEPNLHSADFDGYSGRLSTGSRQHI